MPRASVGRPSLHGARQSIAAKAREYGAEALETMAQVMRDEDAAAGARIDAAAKLLDRGFGRPTEHRQVANVEAAFSELTDDELANAIAYLRAEMAAEEAIGMGTNGSGDPTQLN